MAVASDIRRDDVWKLLALRAANEALASVRTVGAKILEAIGSI